MDFRLTHAVLHANNATKVRKVGARKKAREAGCLIYFIQAGDFVKVGISSKANMRKRLYSIRVNCPFPAHILKVLHTANPIRDERVFHDLLARYHVHGEWFRIDNTAIMELLQS